MRDERDHDPEARMICAPLLGQSATLVQLNEVGPSTGDKWQDLAADAPAWKEERHGPAERALRYRLRRDSWRSAFDVVADGGLERGSRVRPGEIDLDGPGEPASDPDVQRGCGPQLRGRGE